MANNTPWDQYEAAILLEAVIWVYDGKISRSQAVKGVSDKLRMKARMSGFDVDDTFRNEAGITFQMHSMESAYVGYTIFKPASRLFLKTVRERKKRRDKYSRKLREALRMIGERDMNFLYEYKNGSREKDKDNHSGYDKRPILLEAKERKKDFAKWMCRTGMAASSARIYTSALVSGAQVARDSNILKRDIFEETNAEKLSACLNKLMTDDEFVKKNRKRHYQFHMAWKKYIQYLREISLNAVENKDYYNNREDGIYTDEELNMRLKSMASVYDDVGGYDIEWIVSKLGLSVREDEVEKILDNTPWITKVSNRVYSFSKNAIQSIDFDKEAFVRVLMLRYKNGIQIDSIDLEIFRDTYEELIGESIRLDDKELGDCIRNSGVQYMDRVFPAEGIVSSDVKEKIIEYIERSFASGKQVLYYKSILSDLSDDLMYCYNLTDEKMLRSYLEYVCDDGSFYFFGDYITNDKEISISHSQEIESLLLDRAKPLKYEEIFDELSNISQDVIRSEIRTDPNILLNERGQYFHYDVFEYSSDDIEEIIALILSDIEEYGCCIWSQVYEKIRKRLPLFIENNAYLSSLGMRNAMKKKLSGEFEFHGDVISRVGSPISTAMLYQRYGERHVSFSDDDIYKFSKEINSAIYFDDLSKSSIRVSEKLFVAKNQVEFDVEETDKAISTYMSGEYMLIKDFDSFLVFPGIGYEWNVYLLESYLMYYSSKYALLNNGRSLRSVAGAIVKKEGEYNEFIEVCADYIAKSDCKLTKNAVLDYLAEMNLITNRRYSKVDELILMAKQTRLRRDEKNVHI